jgi:predicted nuclease of predicted toxin-antitoxin system
VKLLLGACVWGPACDELRAAGHDVVYVGDWPDDPGDAQILSYAQRERRVLVTLDKDFGTLAVLGGQPHAGIVRLVDIGARQQGDACHRALAHFGVEVTAGAFVTVEPGRLRVRLPAPSSEGT